MTECKVEITSDDLAAMRLVLAASERSRDNTPAWHRFKELVESIEKQVKPVVADPKEFGSIVRAGLDGLSDRVLWMRTATGWISEERSILAEFSWLDHPEVLRVGIGEPPPMTEEEIDESQATAQRNLSHGLQVGVLRCIGGTVDHPAHAMYCPAHGALRDKS